MAVTIKDIAKRADVTPMTVSLSLRGRPGVSSKKREEIKVLAETLGYRPQAAARSMRTQRTNLIGVLLRNAPDKPFHYTSEFEFILGINQSLEPANYVLSVVRIEDVPVDGKHMSRVFREKILDGMIVIAGIPDQAISVVKKLIPHCVFLDTNAWEETGCLRRDEVHCGRTVAQAMVDAGYQRLVWACSKRIHFSHTERLEGIRKVASESGVMLETLALPEWMHTPDSDMLKNAFGPDAVVITSEPNDAVRMVYYGSQLGLCLGRDFSVACCDRTHDVRMSMSGLSCVTYDRMAFGRRAGQMLLEMLKNPESPCQSLRIRSDWFAGDTARGTAKER